MDLALTVRHQVPTRGPLLRVPASARRQRETGSRHKALRRRTWLNIVNHERIDAQEKSQVTGTQCPRRWLGGTPLRLRRVTGRRIRVVKQRHWPESGEQASRFSCPSTVVAHTRPPVDHRLAVTALVPRCLAQREARAQFVLGHDTASGSAVTSRMPDWVS